MFPTECEQIARAGDRRVVSTPEMQGMPRCNEALEDSLDELLKTQSGDVDDAPLPLFPEARCGGAGSLQTLLLLKVDRLCRCDAGSSQTG